MAYNHHPQISKSSHPDGQNPPFLIYMNYSNFTSNKIDKFYSGFFILNFMGQLHSGHTAISMIE